MLFDKKIKNDFSIYPVKWTLVIFDKSLFVYVYVYVKSRQNFIIQNRNIFDHKDRDNIFILAPSKTGTWGTCLSASPSPSPPSHVPSQTCDLRAPLFQLTLYSKSMMS